jgi:chaperonin GroES
MHARPLHDRIFVQRLDEGDRRPLDVKDGDTILCGKYAGQEVTLDGVQYLIMRETDVLAVMDRP